MEYENEIKGILVTFYRDARDGDYLNALAKAIYEIGCLSEKNFSKVNISGSFNHETISKIRNSQSDAEARRIIASYVKKLPLTQR